MPSSCLRVVAQGERCRPLSAVNPKFSQSRSRKKLCKARTWTTFRSFGTDSPIGMPPLGMSAGTMPEASGRHGLTELRFGCASEPQALGSVAEPCVGAWRWPNVAAASAQETGAHGASTSKPFLPPPPDRHSTELPQSRISSHSQRPLCCKCPPNRAWTFLASINTCASPDIACDEWAARPAPKQR